MNPPLERPDTLAFRWPHDAPAPSPPGLSQGYSLASRIDQGWFTRVQHSIGFTVRPRTWSELDPVAMVFVHQASEPVAVAVGLPRTEGWVELAWVAVDPAHRGQGLGRAVCAGLLRELLRAGSSRVFGSTTDDRLHALAIYLSLGFEPVLRPEKTERWTQILAVLATGKHEL